MRDNAIRDGLLRALGAAHLHANWRIDRDSLNALVSSLHPIDPGVPLVRVGPDGDGGYLVPDALDGIAHAFSPGVSTESGFEAALAEHGMNVFLADHSVEGPAVEHPKFHFTKMFVGSFADSTHITLDGWKASTIGSYSGDLLLQMDIEGGEFETLLAASDDLLRQFRIMVIEFHYLHQLWNKPWFLLVKRVFEKMLASHSVVHIHPNNCCGSFRSDGLVLPRVAEFTFLRNDFVRQRVYRSDFPHPLDRDNTGKETLTLPRCWYRGKP